MSAPLHDQTGKATVDAPQRVTTMISCPNVRPMARNDVVAPVGRNANENRWFDNIGFRRHWYANITGLAIVMALLFGGVWIVGEFVRLQKIVACYEAGRRECLPLDLNRELPPRPQ